MAASSDPGLEIDPARASALLAAGEAQLVDVREQREWDAGRIPGARHVPLGTLAERASELDPALPVIVQCRVGGRSAIAAQALRAAGIEAWSLAGGLLRWVDEGLPIEPEDGFVASH
ncbi:MAG TPA: rhodanese-like domain-containing protein [Solirubrobacteraceae bacterium]|nr:rhodanese-like domain-containing protein [Solirubrobacteraceae bacterium]